MDLGLEHLNDQTNQPQNSFSEEYDYFDKLFLNIIEKKTIQRESTENIRTLIVTCGKSETVDTYLKSVVSDFANIDLKSISQEKLVSLLDANLVALDKDIEAAYEGWFNNVVQKIKHAFKADSKCAAIISESIKKWEAVDAETIENKVIDFKLISPEALKTGITYLSALFKSLKEDAESLAEASKWFHGRLSKDQCKQLLNKLKAKQEAFTTKNSATFIKLNDLLMKKNVKGKTFKDAGYTKAATIAMLKQYSSNVAGLLKQIKDLVDLIESCGSKLKIGVMPIVTNDGLDLAVYFEREIKAAYKNLYGYTEDTYDKYLLIDYFMFRLAKEV